MGSKKKAKKASLMPKADHTPFLDAIEHRNSIEADRDHERQLLKLYEQNWSLANVIADIRGAEARLIRYLANKFHSTVIKSHEV